MSMARTNQSVLDYPANSDADQPGATHVTPELEIALLTGGFDKPYALGLSTALSSTGIKLDLIGSNELDNDQVRMARNITFLNLHGDQRYTVATGKKIARHLLLYGRLFRYAATAKPRLFHILWQNKFQLFDRTLLMLYYRLLGKKIVFTAHNVNAAQRDGKDSLLNRLSLRAQYSLADHIFVHTEKMKAELLSAFRIRQEAVSVIPFGINNSIPDTRLAPIEAKQRLGVKSSQKTILFFGGIRPYKGLEYLVVAFQQIAQRDESYRLIIAGEPKKEAAEYWRQIKETIERKQSASQVIQHIKYVTDDDTEVYFKAADVVVLPYTVVFQSGVLFLAYNFGLPVIATDVGSLRDDIVEGETGYLCRSCDAADLARAITEYFDSHLYKTLDRHRASIKAFATERNSWEAVSRQTCKIYARLLNPAG